MDIGAGAADCTMALLVDATNAGACDPGACGAVIAPGFLARIGLSTIGFLVSILAFKLLSMGDPIS